MKAREEEEEREGLERRTPPQERIY